MQKKPSSFFTVLLFIFISVSPVNYVLNGLPEKNVINDDKINIDDKKDEFVVKNSPTSSTLNMSYDKYSYHNIHYRLVDYKKVYDYPSTILPWDILGIQYVGGAVDANDYYRTHIYRLLILKDGTVYIFNQTTLSINGDYFEDSVLSNGGNYTLQYIGSSSIDTSSFSPNELLIQDDYLFGISSTPGNFYIAGSNTTDNSIVINTYFLNETSTSIDYVSTFRIYNPISITSSDTRVFTFIFDQVTNRYYVGGRFINGTDSIPFAYGFNNSFSSVETDILDLNGTSNYWAYFDDVVLFINGYTRTIFTNKNVIIYNNSCAQLNAFEMPLEITDYTSLYFFSHFDSNYNIIDDPNDNYTLRIFSYNFISFATVVGGSYNLIMKNNGTVDGVKLEFIRNENANIFIETLGGDNMISCIFDLKDGFIISDEDRFTKVWKRWVVASGNMGGAINFYFPHEIMKLSGAETTGIISTRNFEVLYGDSRALWIAEFTCRDAANFKVGNSSVNRAVMTKLDVSHKRATSQFQCVLSGYIERNVTSSEFVEIGLIPLYARPIDLLESGDAFLFTVDKVYAFPISAWKNNGGVPLTSRSTFQTFGIKTIEFQVSFDSEFCPFIDYNNVSAIVLQQCAISVQMLVWERYNNGSYTQRLLSGFTAEKSTILDFDYTLETSLVIQDSHLLDELNIYSNGIQYNSFDLMFVAPKTNFIVIDKFTGLTLYNVSNQQFSDPLVTNIVSKYEFYVKLYSTLDQFGLDFNLVNIFVNNTEITTEFVRILSPNANITIKDFADEVIKSILINKQQNGSYIKIGLPVAQIIISNQYNFTINFYLTKKTRTIYYQIPAQTSIVLRLALGEYRYMVTNVNGTELFDETVTFTDSQTISIGSIKVEAFPEFQGITILDVVVSTMLVIGILALLLFLATRLNVTRKSTSIEKKPTATSSSEKSNGKKQKNVKRNNLRYPSMNRSRFSLFG